MEIFLFLLGFDLLFFQITVFSGEKVREAPNPSSTLHFVSSKETLHICTKI